MLDILKKLEDSLEKGAIEKIISSYKRGDPYAYIDFLKGKKNIKINRTTLYGWKKGKQPDAIKTLNNIHKYNFHKINKIVLARLFGWGLGDGGINKKNPRYYFICGRKDDLINIKKYIKKNIKNIKPIIVKNNSGGKITRCDGTINYLTSKEKTYILYIRNHSFARFLYAIGLPKGKKVLQKFNLPEWIKKESKEVKKEFLDAIFECEGEKSSLSKTKTKIILKSPIFSLNKKVEHKINLMSFLNEIIELFSECGVKCGLDPKIREGNKRKDGNITCSARFWVNGSSINLIKFSKVISYKFNKEKKQLLKKTVKEAKKKIKKFNKQKEKFKEALVLHNEGMNNLQIAKKLNVTHPTIKEWTTKREHLPRYFNTNLGELLK